MARAANEASANNRRRLFPIVGGMRSYDRRWLRGDVIAGVAVAALIIPKNLGYADIAGVPLLAALLGLFKAVRMMRLLDPAPSISSEGMVLG